MALRKQNELGNDLMDLAEDQELLDQELEEDESMEHANSQLAALTLEETYPERRVFSAKRFGEPMEEEIYALKIVKIAEGESISERYHVTPPQGLADSPEAGPELEHDDDVDDEDSIVASDDNTTQKGDGISEWLVNFLNAVLDDDEDDEDPSLNFKEKRRQFRKRVNKCLAEALGDGNDDDVVSIDQEVSDEEDVETFSDEDDDDHISDEDDDILSVEDGEEVSGDDVVNSNEDGSDVDDDIFSDEEDDYLADEDNDDNNNNDY